MIRLLIALAVGFVTSLVFTRVLIFALKRFNLGQPIGEDAPSRDTTKTGTPTMGGLAIVSGGVLGYILSHSYHGIYTNTGLIIISSIGLAAGVGFLDDHLKVSREHNIGLNKRAKFIGLIVVGVFFCGTSLAWAEPHTTLSFTRFDSPGLELGSWGWAALAVLLIVSTSNAVNLTDGLDGLTAGSCAFGLGAYVLICFWRFREEAIYQVPHALDMAVVAAAFAGGCVGFLWWNAHPAHIFMGDTGSLALGTGLACLALSSNTQLLLPIIAGLYVFETLSVIVQVAVFKTSKIISGVGKRVFRMAPLHHHFELLGWEETWVIVRFWILAILFISVGLGLFYADYIAITDL